MILSRSIAGLLMFFAALASAFIIPAHINNKPGHPAPIRNCAPAGLRTPAERVEQDYGKLPLSFEMNRGQAEKGVKFTSGGRGYDLALSPSAAVLTLRRAEREQSPKSDLSRPREQALNMHPGPAARGRKEEHALRMELVGGNLNARMDGLDPLPGTASYFIGSDPAKWRSGIPTFKRVRYEQVYAGVDRP
jgi:hypothetical protein